MDLIVSKYTICFSDQGKNFIYNTETGVLCVVEKKLMNALQDRDIALLDSMGHLESLLKNRFVLKKEEDGVLYQEAKLRNIAMSYSQKNLSIAVIPHSGCNFACPYCFEENKKYTLMSENTLSKLFDFIADHKQAETVSITWYGGEPLLGYKRIKEFYSSYREKINKKIISHSLVTNGYLLNEEKALFFESIKLSSLQITLDGKKERHDTLRSLKNGKPSFDKIISNIDRALRIMKSCQFAIRVNIDCNSVSDFADLYKELHERWSGYKIKIYPGYIRNETRDKLSLCSECITPCRMLEFIHVIKQQGLHIIYKPSRNSHYGCMMNALHSYVIGSRGEIYKCWNDVSNDQKIIGYIGEKELINKSLYYSYMNECSPFSNPECEDCHAFPICDGWCGWYQYKNRSERGQFDICSPFKSVEVLKKVLVDSLEKNKTTYPTIFL